MSVAVAGTYTYNGSAAGVDGYTGKFIPEVWSGKLAVKFYISTCLSSITNNDWEGEINDLGDKVRIRSIPDVTIRTYQKGMNLTTEVPTAGVIDLLIDQGKYFATVVDDIDKVQSDIALMDTFSTDAAEQMKIAVEQTVFGSVYAQAAAKNKGQTAGIKSNNIVLGVAGTPLQITKANVLDWIVDMGTVLDEQNVPETGRWLLVPAWIAGLIKKSDLKDASLSGDGTSILRNGRLGAIDRFTLYMSNNVVQGADGANVAYEVMAGTRDAISFASQISKVETMRSTATFGNILRGLNVFGFKVTKPEALVHSHIMK